MKWEKHLSINQIVNHIKQKGNIFFHTFTSLKCGLFSKNLNLLTKCGQSYQYYPHFKCCEIVVWKYQSPSIALYHCVQFSIGECEFKSSHRAFANHKASVGTTKQRINASHQSEQE